MIRREIEAGICLLTFDRPDSGANIFDAATMKDLSEHLSFIENESSLKGLIITSAKKSIFIAGADLATLLRQAATGDMREFIAEGQRVFNRLASLKIPTCAAIHGACAGGGYEITLACDYRVASNDPATEDRLSGNDARPCSRMGRCDAFAALDWNEKAAEVILKGKLYSAAEAKEIGLVDEVVTREQLIEAARAKIAAGKGTIALLRERRTAQPPVRVNRERRPKLLEMLRQRGRRKSFPKRCALRSTIRLRMELDAIVELGETESTRNLIRNFFLADKYRKGSIKTPAEKIVHAAVIGAGVMGSGIAQWLSSRGVSVILRDVNSEAIDRGLTNIEKTYADAVKRGLMSEEKAKDGRACIVASTARSRCAPSKS